MQRYLVMTLRTPNFDSAVIEPHYAYLDRLRERGVLELFGPFGDKSGGAYLIRAQDLDEARAIAHADPVHVSGSSRVTVYEWDAKEALVADEHG